MFDANVTSTTAGPGAGRDGVNDSASPTPDSQVPYGLEDYGVCIVHTEYILTGEEGRGIHV